jgi:hypothetical protein
VGEPLACTLRENGCPNKTDDDDGARIIEGGTGWLAMLV